MNGLEKVTELADKLSPSEQLALVEHLAHRLRKQSGFGSTPVSLRGAWEGKFPDDVESEIRAIRDEWKKDLGLE